MDKRENDSTPSPLDGPRRTAAPIHLGSAEVERCWLGGAIACASTNRGGVGASLHQQGRRRRGGGPVSVREEAALGKPSNDTGVDASAGDALAWHGNLGVGLAHGLGRS